MRSSPPPYAPTPRVNRGRPSVDELKSPEGLQADPLASAILIYALTVAFLAAVLSYVLVGVYPERVAGALLPEIREALDVHDSKGQRIAYLTAIFGFSAALAVGYAAASKRRARSVGHIPSWIRPAVSIALATLGVLWALTQSNWLGFSHFFGRYLGVFYEPGRVDALASIGVCSALAFGVSRLPRRISSSASRLGLAVTCGYAAAAMAIGFWRPLRLDTFSAEALSAIADAHLAVLLGDRQQLTSGLQLFDLVQPYYGFLSPVLGSILETQIGWFSVGQSLRFVQVAQVAFFATFAASILLLPYRTAGGVTLAFLSVLPWVHSLHGSVLTPNQSGLRYLGLSIFLLALSLAIRLPRGKGAFGLGLVSGVCILVNYETGVAVSASLAFFLWLRLRPFTDLRGGISTAAAFAAGFGVAQAAFWLVAACTLQQAPRPLTLLFWLFASDVESALLGRPLYLDVVVLTVILHASIVVGQAVLNGRLRQITNEEALCASAAIGILIWSFYWFSRPHPWNAWSLLVLYSPILVRTVATLGNQLSKQLILRPETLMLTTILVPATILSNFQLAKALERATVTYRQPTQAAQYVSDVWLERGIANALLCKAAALRAAADSASVTYITAHSFFMPTMAGVVQPLKTREIFFGVSSKPRYDRLVEEIKQLNPQRILFDDGKAPLAISSGHARFFRRLADDLTAGYTLEKDLLRGWISFRRQSDKSNRLDHPKPPPSACDTWVPSD
jgi:hypothetical protein